MMVLAVSRWAQRGTSGMIEGLAACFTGLEDPRETRRCDHQLVDILVIAVGAVIACAESWEDIELYGRPQQAGLAGDLPGPAERHPHARHVPSGLHAARPGRVRGVLRAMGAVLGRRGRARGGGDRWQDRPALGQPPP